MTVVFEAETLEEALELARQWVPPEGPVEEEGEEVDEDAVLEPIQTEEQARELIAKRGQTVVIGFTGFRGRGKSNALTYFAKSSDDIGVQVFHNGPLRFGTAFSMRDVVQLPRWLRRCCCVFDEMQNYADAGRPLAFTSQMVTKTFMQVRKRQMKVLWSSNDEYRVLESVRYQTDILIRCKSKDEGLNIPIDVIDVHGRWVDVPAGVDLADREADALGIIRRAWQFWHLYDTDWVADPFEMLALTRESIESELSAKGRLDELEWLQQVLSIVASAGITKVNPTALSRGLADYFDYHQVPTELGKRLGDIGLQKPQHTNKGQYYDLSSLVRDDLIIQGDAQTGMKIIPAE